MKTEIKARYLAELPKVYPNIYTPESRPLKLANIAADNALAGRMVLKGDVWAEAVKRVTGWTRWTMAQLAELPE